VISARPNLSVEAQHTDVLVADLLQSLRDKGVSLWSEAGQLRYKAPKGAFSKQELETLGRLKPQVLAALEQRPHRAPLTYSQLAHMQLNQAAGSHVSHPIAAAMRIQGDLDVPQLERSLVTIVQRHDALRTHLGTAGGELIQCIDERVECELPLTDLTSVRPDRRDMEIQHQITRRLLEPMDLTTGPLFRAYLLKLDRREHVLIALMEHLVSDGYSMGLLMRDLFLAYSNMDLPPITIQFSDHAIRQQQGHKALLETHESYWREHLETCGELRLPVDRSAVTQGKTGLAAVPVRIASGLAAELRHWCRERHTTVAMAMFAMYAEAVLRWCVVSEGIIQYQSDGRSSESIENTIGYFAYPLYVRVTSNPRSFDDFLQQVTEEYCRAYERADSSYLASREPRPHFTRNTVFNWRPRRSFNGSHAGASWSPVHFVYPPRELCFDADPVILLAETGGEILGDLYYPACRFSGATMERFVRRYVALVETIVTRSHGAQQRLKYAD
jgi:hypothetical protein